MRDVSFRQATEKAGSRLGEPTKTVEQSFADWEGHTFGFGYGTGEPHILRALKGFFDAFGVDDRPNSYNYEALEEAVTAPVAWLLINRLCQVDIIEYGTSPRFAWLTKEGEALRTFLASKTVGELEEIVGANDDHCYPDACNCGLTGYEKGRVCYNPFWPHHH
jgi:hypothetical protein